MTEVESEADLFGEWPSTVAAADAMFFKGEANPRTRGTGHFIYVLDRVPEWDRFASVWDRASRVVPPLYKRVVRPTGFGRLPRWEDDPDFDLSFHLRRMSVPSPGTLREVFDYAEVDGMTPHDPGRPLWQVTLLEGLEGDRAAVLMKFHHSWVDGNASTRLAMATYDSDRDGDLRRPTPQRPVSQTEDHSTLGRLAESSRTVAKQGQVRAERAARLAQRVATDPTGLIRETAGVASSALRMVRQVPGSPSPLFGHRSPGSRFDVIDISFPSLKAATKPLGFTINDGYLAGVTGGLRLYHDRLGAAADTVPMGVPISTRTDGDRGLGNQASVTMFAAPIGIADPVERMRALHDRIGSARSEPAMEALAGLANILVHLPDSLMEGPLMNLIRIDVAASQVRGLLDPTFLAGAQIMRSYGFGPKVGLAAFIGMVTHLDTCCVTIHSDPAAVTDPDLLVSCLRQGFDEVIAVGEPPISTARKSRS